MAEKAKGMPNSPSSYLTLKQLQELRLQEKQRQEDARPEKIKQEQEEEEALRLRKLKEEEDRHREKLRWEREVLKSKKPLRRRSNPAGVEPSDRGRKDESAQSIRSKPQRKWEGKKKTEKTSKESAEQAVLDPRSENGSDEIRPDNGRLRRDGTCPVVRSVKGTWGSGIASRVGRDGGGAEMRPRSTTGMRARRVGRLVRFEDLSGKGPVWVQKSS